MTGRLAGRTLWVLIVAALLPYLNALPNDFTLDDHGLILHNQAVVAFDLATLWGQDYWAGYDSSLRSGLYRPVTLTSFAAEFALFGWQPLGYHLNNLLLHLLVTLLSWSLFRRFAGASTALWGAAVFAVLPGHSEAVLAIVGRADLLATVGSLAALLVWTGADGWRRTLGGGCCFALALLSKEQAAVVPALLLCVGWLQHRRDGQGWRWPPLVASAAILAVYLGLRQVLLGGIAVTEIQALDNPLVELHGAERVLAALAVASRYALLLVAPARLSADYSFGAIDVRHMPTGEIADGLLLVLLAGVATWWFVRRPETPGLAVMWLMVCFAPFVNVLFPIGTILAERISYAPSVGYALGVGWALDGARRHLGYRVVQRLGLALLLVLGLRTAVRCTDWRDELQLFGAVVAAYPESARGHKGLAKALQDAGRVAEAEQEYRAAIEIYPRFDTAHYNLAILLHGTARYEEALSHFDKACVLRPEFADAHLNRGVTLSRLGRLQESRQATQRAAELRPEWDAPRVNLQEINTAIDRQGEQR